MTEVNRELSLRRDKSTRSLTFDFVDWFVQSIDAAGREYFLSSSCGYTQSSGNGCRCGCVVGLIDDELTVGGDAG